MSHGKFLATNHKSEVQYDMTMIEVKNASRVRQGGSRLGRLPFTDFTRKAGTQECVFVVTRANLQLPGPSAIRVYCLTYMHITPLLQGFTQAAFHIFTTCQALQLSP